MTITIAKRRLATSSNRFPGVKLNFQRKQKTVCALNSLRARGKSSSRLHFSFSGLQERVLIEIQGTIEVPEKPEDKVAFVLYWQDAKTAVCLIGHHMVEGQMKTLEKPMIVLDTKTFEKCGPQRYRCSMVYVAKKKMVFKTRPKPILY